MRIIRGNRYPLHVGTFTNGKPERLSKRHADWMTKLWLSEVFQQRDEHDDVHGFAFEVWQRLFDCPLLKLEFLQCLATQRDLEIHSNASLELWLQRDQLRGAIATTEFQHLQIVAAGQIPAYRAVVRQNVLDSSRVVLGGSLEVRASR